MKELQGSQSTRHLLDFIRFIALCLVICILSRLDWFFLTLDFYCQEDKNHVLGHKMQRCDPLIEE